MSGLSADSRPFLNAVDSALRRDDRDAAIALALRALDAGQFALAARAFQAVIAAEPFSAQAHYYEGFAEEQLGQLERAERSYREAHRLDPAMTDAVARLASLAARRGDHDRARTFADEALTRHPHHAVAHFAHVVCDLGDGRFGEAEQRARAIAGNPEMMPLVRANATSFAADALDGQGRHADAFALYALANESLRALYRGFGAPGRETGSILAARLAGEFAATSQVAWQSEASPGPLPDGALGIAFVIGFPRSGTTLLGQILAAHSRVSTIEEKPLLAEGLQTFIHSPGGLARLSEMPPTEVARLRQVYFAGVRDEGVAAQGRVIVDQAPFNTLHLPLVAKLFPEAKIVFAARDPRDIVLSCFRRLFAMNAYVYEFLTLAGTAEFYDRTMQLAGTFRTALPVPWFDIRNEDVVADFAGEVRRLCAFLGLAYEDAMQDFAGRARASATPSAMQVIRGIKGDGVGHWRNYEAELAPVLPVLAPWVERFGYE
ncbi:MAG TPA: sulfotransferase [Rhizomicrobium sp.]|nr:sulfotransferase [Rhizomicrobium sp.]